jgi:hypothetical protein
MQTRLMHMREQCATVRAEANARIENIQRPIRNEILLHYRQARDMQQRALDLGLLPDPIWTLGRILELRCQALKAVYQLHDVPSMVETDDILWPAMMKDEEGLAIEPDMDEADIEATLVGYLSPYVAAIGIRGLHVRVRYSLFGEEVYLTLRAPVFP